MKQLKKHKKLPLWQRIYGDPPHYVTTCICGKIERHDTMKCDNEQEKTRLEGLIKREQRASKRLMNDVIDNISQFSIDGMNAIEIERKELQKLEKVIDSWTSVPSIGVLSRVVTTFNGMILCYDIKYLALGHSLIHPNHSVSICRDLETCWGRIVRGYAGLLYEGHREFQKHIFSNALKKYWAAQRYLKIALVEDSYPPLTICEGIFVLYNFGAQLYLMAKRPKKALKWCSTATSFHSSLAARARYNISNIYLIKAQALAEIGRYQGAKKEMEKAMRMDLSNLSIKRKYAQLTEMLDQLSIPGTSEDPPTKIRLKFNQRRVVIRFNLGSH